MHKRSSSSFRKQKGSRQNKQFILLLTDSISKEQEILVNISNPLIYLLFSSAIKSHFKFGFLSQSKCSILYQAQLFWRQPGNFHMKNLKKDSPFLCMPCTSNSIVMSSLSFVLINAYHQSNWTSKVIFEIKVSQTFTTI